MEERKNNTGLVVLITVLVMLVLGMGAFIIYDQFINKTNEPTTGENNKVDNKEDQNTKNVYEIQELKNIQDLFSDNDTNDEKAKKIAREFMNAVNNKDWYYTAKLVGVDADDFIKYGIYNYNIDINDYRNMEDSFIFFAKYDWDKTKLNALEDVGLGTMLVITFEEGGRIKIDPNCTGV